MGQAQQDNRDPHVYYKDRHERLKTEANALYKEMTAIVLKTGDLAKEVQETAVQFHAKSKEYVAKLKEIEDEIVKPVF